MFLFRKRENRAGVKFDVNRDVCCRGLVAIQILRELQSLLGGRPIRGLFDYVCGVSTGALLATMLAVNNVPLDECELLYKVRASWRIVSGSPQENFQFLNSPERFTFRVFNTIILCVWRGGGGMQDRRQRF